MEESDSGKKPTRRGKLSQMKEEGGEGQGRASEEFFPTPNWAFSSLFGNEREALCNDSDAITQEKKKKNTPLVVPPF